MQARESASKIAPVLDILKDRFADRLSTAPAVLERHGQDESYHKSLPPEGVVFANSTEEVAEVVKLCAEHGVPVIPFGTGTSLEGHIGAVAGGICIDLSNMDKVLAVNAEDLDCRVQAGVTRKQLNTHLRDQGLFFPIDPGADASIGGMAATRASGTNAVRYGTMRENVLSLTVVTASGEIIRTARRARKSSAGYDLTRLFVGSEGTLGVITEVALKLYGIPEATSAAVCQFDDLESAVSTVILTIQSGVPMARIELLNSDQMGACIRFSKLEGYETKPTLFFEFHGSETGVKEQAEMVEGIASEFGGSAFQWAEKAEDRNKLWEARHNVHYAIKSMRPNCEVMATDICVPISRLAEAILEAQKDLIENGLTAGIVGHVGDGNFHVGYCIDPNNAEEVAAAKGHNERMVFRALEMDGTCTGEHGVGQGKIRYMEAEHGLALNAMQAIKQALDPQGIMNPGKVLPS
ncbi:FAD-binding oxidoreductase [Nisaea nitritireducens]|uniref:FAD-binding oxidoreductase n=1 Tax=Nisaea nitritireducens TaxID=568392 RepID=UPI001866F8DA|nr:FAD-linked oxidase C-terminal domain-containing protein [Nisaea nitritireducens]